MTSQTINKIISNTLYKESEKQVVEDSIKKINLQDFPIPSSVLMTKKQKKEIASSDSCQTNSEEPLVTNLRNMAFNHMADKTQVAKLLTCTKVCRNIQKDPQTGKFGVCSRKYCTFAHSIAELQPARCSFDNTCRFKYGRIDWNTKLTIPDSNCKFRHTDETIEQYYFRSDMVRPELPATSEHTRKIPTVNTQPPVETEVIQLEDDSDMSSDSETEEDNSKPVKKEPKNNSPNSDIQIIRVPTKELAEIALKALFDRGQFNVQVIIE